MVSREDCYGFDEHEKLIFKPEELGECIRARRKKLGYTQQEVAEFNRCSPRFVSELERGKAGANLRQMLKIAHSIGIDMTLWDRG